MAAIGDRASRVRTSALAYGQSVPEVNEWTRFRVHVGRVGDDAIKEMRKAGELVEKGGDRKSKHTERALILADLIEKRPTQRATDWSRLNALTEREIDEIFERANAREQLVAEKVLIRLAMAGA